MKRIYKYELKTRDEQEIVLPQGYKILDVQMQWSELQLWALVDPGNNDAKVKIRIYGTGHPVVEEGKYISTFQANSGAFVGHVFEV